MGDLDLSQLRLTKKDLETLSSITPSLSKNIQDQLLAQLPPNQAKKLSRTLSIQNQNGSGSKKSSETAQIYRRSVSSSAKSQSDRHSRDSVTPTNEVFDSINNNSIRNASQYRNMKNTSRDDKLFDDSINNNNNSSSSNNNNGSMYRERTLSPEGYRYQKNTNRTSSPSEDIERACFSPPPLDEKKSKRYSRAMAIYDEPRKTSESATHKILREMREKSHETEKDEANKIYYSNKYTSYNSDLQQNRSFNNKDSTTSGNSQSSSMTSSINNKILDELNSISLLNSQLEKFDQLEISSKDKSLKKKSSSKSIEETSKKSSKSRDKIDEIKPPETKLTRPKSFIKEVPLKACPTQEYTAEKLPLDTNKLDRPKSFPNSKLTPPKEVKKLPEINLDEPKSVEEPPPAAEPKKVKKIVKVVKKSSKKSSSSTTTPVESTQSLPIQTPQSSVLTEPEVIPISNHKKEKEKSPEKKGGKGLLYTIGQKFEKLRDTKTKKSDEIKDEKKIESSTLDMKEKKKKIKAMLNEDVDEVTRQERKSKIDALIKNLKEKTVPNVELTESGLIKRAVSVEEMPNTFNKNAVNKVLGLFKRIEKENENKTNRVQNTKSTSFLSSMDAPSSLDYYANISSGKNNNNNNSNNSSSNNFIRERPKSSGFVSNKHSKNNCTSTPHFEPLANICESKIPVKYSCPDCKPTNIPSSSTVDSTNIVTKRHSNDEKQHQTIEEKERLKNNRKGLMLDFSRFKSPEPDVNDRKPANYSFPPPLPEVKRNVITPTYDNLANYSSSAFDASISSSLSPNDEINNDGWSTCSDDHAVSTHPLGSASLSRLSRHTNPIDEPESPESVVDRIRRKSFYSRFNEKKTKRVSNIVGPAAKEYYRERSKPLEYTRSATSVIPDILSSTRASSVESAVPTHHSRASSISRYIPTSSAANRSLSQTRASSKYSNNTDIDPLPSSNTYRRTESNHLATLPPPYHVHHSHHHHELSSINDDLTSKLKSNRNTMYDSSSSSSNTPTSLSSLYTKRRSFVSSSPSSSVTTNTSGYYTTASKPPTTFVDGYATIGRKMRQYNTRSVSLLDPNIINSSNNHYDHYRVNGNIETNGSTTRYVYCNDYHVNILWD